MGSILFLLVKKLINGSLFLFTRILYRNSLIKNRKIVPSKILIIRNGSIGDSITAFPAIAAVKAGFSKSRIEIFTNSGSPTYVGMSELLDESFYNRIVNYYGWGYIKLFREIKKNNYNLLINLSQDKSIWHREFAKLLFFRFCGIKSAVGFEVGTIRFLLKFQNKLPNRFSETERLNRILTEVGILNVKNEYPIKLSNFDRRILRAPDSSLTDRKNNIIAIVIGAKRNQNKWPIDYWKELIDMCINFGYRIFIVGSAEDRLESRKLHRDGVVDLCGNLSISQTASFFRSCGAVVSNDTGPLHLAYALDIFVIGLFSAWQLSKVWFPPENVGITLVDYSVNCSLCYSNKCPSNVCMQNIYPRFVFDVLKKNVF